MRPRVFLSHSKLDSVLIRKVAAALNMANIDVWFDEFEMLPGQSLSKRIFDALPENDIFFLYLTKNSINSRWVQEELESALMLTREGRDDFVALFVDSDETRLALPVNLRRLYSPILTSEIFYEPLLKLIAKIWNVTTQRLETTQKHESMRTCYRMFNKTNDEYEAFFIDELSKAQEEILLFGLGRQFYRRQPVQLLLQEKAKKIPINIFLMHPFSAMRKIRYDFEPKVSDFSGGANLHDPQMFVDSVLVPLVKLKNEVDESIKDKNGNNGLHIKLHEFNLTFAFEKIDDKFIVMHYGYNKRGSDSPIFVFNKNSHAYSYFFETANWIKILPEIGKIIDISDFLPQLNSDKTG